MEEVSAMEATGFNTDFVYSEYDEIPIENIESIGFNERLKNQQMIAIRSIECTNFKSFEGTVTLGPFSNQFSSILGPNGSGKSNVIDSLLFVFGYRASKIRSKKLSILIHKSSKSQNCNSCSVKINFIYRNQSNSTDHQSSENENTFSIKRTVNLNNSSQYFLDEQPCSYKAVAEKLHYFGVDVHHSRFLILQGEVEQISTMKPKKQPNDSADGMLEYIEDVVGTSCLVEPIQTYESRIAKLKDYEGYLISELKKAEKSKTSLEKKKDETVSFLNSENFVSKIKYYINYAKKEESSLKIEELEKILISLNENFNKKTENLNTKTTELKENEKLDKDLSRKLAKKHQNEADLKAKFDDCEASDSKMLQLLTHINQDKSEAEKKLEKVKKELESIELSPEAYKIKSENLKQLILETEKSIEVCQNQLNKAMNDFQSETADLQQSKSDSLTNLSEMQDSFNEAKKRLQLSQLELEQMLEQKSNLEEQIKTAVGQESQLKTENDLLNKENGENEKNLAKFQKALTLSQSDYKTLTVKAEAVENRLDEKKQKLQIMSQNQGSKVKNNKLVEFLRKKHDEGKIKGEIYGRLGDLGSVEKIYDVAVSTASSKLDNIVVESLDTAVQSIEQMKVHSAGTASFIILEKMKPCQNQKPLNSGAGTSANQIFDLIKVSDKKFLPAFKFAFGNTFVADNEEEAERLAFRSKQRQRVVTLKGSLIEVTGAMSGGGNPSRGRMQIYNQDNSLHCDASTTLFDSNVYDSLKIEVENIEKEFESLQSSITKILDTKNSLELSIDELTEKLKINNIKLAENYRTLKEISEKSKIFSKKLQQFEVENSKKISKCEVSLKKLRKDYDSCESRLKDSKSRYESIENQLKAISDRLIDPAEKQLKSVQSQLTQQKQELFLCTPVNNKKKMDKLKSSQKSLIEKISEKCKSLEEIEQKMKNNEVCALKISDEMEKIKSEIETLTVSNKDQENKNAELMKEISEIKSLVKEMSEKLKALKGEKKELENIVEKINHQNLAFALNETDTGLKKKIGNEKSIEIIKEISILVENKDPQEVLKEAEKQFGVFTQIPDCRIIKEFKDVQDIYLDLLAKLEKHESVKSAQKSLRNHLKQMRKSKFNEALLLLNSRLKKLYNALTMGGIAELELLDNLSPFAQGLQLTVMPPNKTWRNVGNLSGGEKTLSSLALVFALHSLRPSPFYILDEIDAALDFRNVSIISEYLHKQAEQDNTQFLVISLREHMFHKSKNFLAVYKVEDCSHTLMLSNPDLTV